MNQRHSFKSMLHNPKSFRNILSLDPSANNVNFSEFHDISESDHLLQCAASVFTIRGTLSIIFSFLTMHDLWWTARFVCKHWFKHCLCSKESIDFDGKPLEQFLLGSQKVNCLNLEYAFQDLMCHLCWRDLSSLNPPQRPLTLTRMTSLSISVMCILKKAITDEHLKELSLCHCNTLKKLDLNNIIEGISCQGLNECLNNLQKLKTMSMETNSYSATTALRTLVQNACPKKEWKYIDLSAKDIFKTRITFHRDVEDVEPERKKKKYDAIPFTHE